MLTICSQTSYMLARMIERQETDFKQFGGVRERMHAARSAAKTAEELSDKAAALRRKIDQAVWSLRRRNGWEDAGVLFPR